MFNVFYSILLFTGTSLFCSSLEWSAYETLLSRCVQVLHFTHNDHNFTHNGVNYKVIHGNAEIKALFLHQKSILKRLTPPSKKNEKLAFWINAYNFFTLVEIANNYPVQSMMKIGWKNKAHLVDNTKHSLDEIENKIIRPLNEPKIHFAINCASVGCPSLQKSIFTPGSLELQLKKATQNALKNPLHLRYSSIKKQTHIHEISSLFHWFKADFEVAPYDSLLKFINTHSSQNVTIFKPSIKYDWDLNTVQNIQNKMKSLKVTQNDG